VWWYAMRLKKTMVWGNLAVSFMSSLTIGMAWFYEWILLKQTGAYDAVVRPVTEITAGIVVFAFSLTFIREVIKDMEDVEGDLPFGCRSLPIRLGIPATKRILLVITIVLLALLLTAQYFLYQRQIFLVVYWLIPAVEIPLLLFLYRMASAASPIQYHRLSSMLKWIMVGGISSMLFIWINLNF